MQIFAAIANLLAAHIRVFAILRFCYAADTVVCAHTFAEHNFDHAPRGILLDSFDLPIVLDLEDDHVIFDIDWLDAAAAGEQHEECSVTCFDPLQHIVPYAFDLLQHCGG